MFDTTLNIAPFCCIGCDRNTFFILNCHISGASEISQVVIVALSSEYLFFLTQNQLKIAPVHNLRLQLQLLFFNFVFLFFKTGESVTLILLPFY